MRRLQPDWIGELIGICAADDWSDVHSRLGHSSVSPMFLRLMPTHDDEDVTGYSRVEVQACRAGLLWLSQDYPREFAALEWEMRQWKRKHLELQDDHDTLVAEAARLLADFVDRACT